MGLWPNVCTCVCASCISIYEPADQFSHLPYEHRIFCLSAFSNNSMEGARSCDLAGTLFLKSNVKDMGTVRKCSVALCQMAIINDPFEFRMRNLVGTYTLRTKWCS